MKTMIFILSILFSFGVNAQFIVPVSTQETVSLIFPFPIVHVDRGTTDVLVQQPKQPGNILLVKAASDHISSTNLSVITEDNAVYSFAIRYAAQPNHWIYQIPLQSKMSVETYANGILDNPRNVRGPGDMDGGIRAWINGIYVKDKVMYYQVKVINFSPIDYDIDLIKWIIKDKVKGKRTAIQENELLPFYVAGNVKHVPARGESVFVVAVDKLTVPDAKLLVLQIMEENGGRHLKVKIKNKHLLQAKVLPDLR